ncbi:MAG: hypothetical protein BJ554DRAFT_108, partial [Olpidium bornovanus]
IGGGLHRVGEARSRQPLSSAREKSSPVHIRRCHPADAQGSGVTMPDLPLSGSSRSESRNPAGSPLPPRRKGDSKTKLPRLAIAAGARQAAATAEDRRRRAGSPRPRRRQQQQRGPMRQFALSHPTGGLAGGGTAQAAGGFSHSSQSSSRDEAGRPGRRKRGEPRSPSPRGLRRRGEGRPKWTGGPSLSLRASQLLVRPGQLLRAPGTLAR